MDYPNLGSGIEPFEWLLHTVPYPAPVSEDAVAI